MGTIKSIDHSGIRSWILFVLIPYCLLICPAYIYSQQTYTWTGAVSQAFNVAGNWSPSGIPGQYDTIILNSGTISIATGNQVKIGGIYLKNGTITATDSVTFSGNMYWSGGTWSGTGILTCPTNAFLFILGTSNKILNQTVLENKGKIFWEGSGNISLINAANLKNWGLFEINNNSSFNHGSGNLTYFNNLSSGIIRKYSDGKTIFGVTLNFINEGLFEVLNGSLEIRSNGTFSGTLEIKNGSSLLLNGGQITWTSSSLLKTNGEVILSGTYEFGGTYDVLKKTTLTLNTSDFTGTVTNLGDTLNISGGQINFLSEEINVPVIQITSGSLGGTAAVQVTQVFNWSGGNINGTGSVNVPVNAKMNITGDLAKYIANRTLNNLGTISWEGEGKIYISGGGVINNSGLFDIKNNSALYHAAGTSSVPTHFNNLPSGIIRKYSDGKTTWGQTVGLYFDNQGLIDLQKGTLSLGATASYTGNFHCEKNTLVSIETGTHDFNPGINLDIEGTLSIIAGVTRFNSDSISLPKILMTGGELGGSGIIIVPDTIIWSGGSLIDTNYLNIDTGGVLILSGIDRKNIIRRKIFNNGHIYIYGGELLLAPYSIISNQGELVIEGPFNGITASGGGTLPEICNLDNGSLFVNASNGLVNCRAYNFINHGYLEINHGVFDISKGYSGKYTQMNGTTKLNSGEFISWQEILIEGGIVKGTGHIGGSLFNSGIISPGSDATSLGSISISGQYKQDSSGVLQIDIGGRSPVTGYDQLTTGNAVLSGKLEINYIRNYNPVPEDKFRVVRWLSQSYEGEFDTITNLDYGVGQTLEAKYTINDLTLNGNLARKDIWLQVIGPKEIRPGQDVRVKILYGNESTDTVVFPMSIEFKNIDDFTLLFDYLHFPTWIPWADPAAVIAYPDLVKDIFFNGETGSVPLILTIPGRKQGDALPNFNQLGVNLNPSCKSAKVTVSIGDPLNPDIENCLWGIAGELVGFLPGGDCVKAGVKLVLSGMQAYSDEINGRPVTLGGWITSNSWDIAKCAVSLIPGMSLVTKTANTLDIIMGGVGQMKLAMDCKAALLPQEGGESAQISFKCVVSKDPNQKAGPDGYNSLNYIKGNNPLAYAVFFENVDTATAPAQKVIIKDTLNPAHWDFSTFSFTSISFGDTTIYPPAWVHDFYIEVDLRPQNDLIVGITGKLDDETGIITCEFVSLDPVTHNPITDPLAGFLPPDVLPPEGEGNVIYIIQPNLDLPSGTGIGSPATIFFDNNDPMSTNIWENHLDRTPPSSSMGYINEIQVSDQIGLNWIGSDDHSGIRKYFLYVSENEGPFIEWLVTSDTSCVFEGDTCSHYKFYVLALDSAGNKEPEKSPEIQVLVNPFVQPVLEAAGPTEFCEGDSILLRGETGDSLVYEWYRDNQLITDAHDSVYYAKLPGDYILMTGLSEVCSGLSDPITVIINMPPDATITASGNLLETISGEASYQWYFNSNPIASATGSSYIAEIDGDYQVQVTGHTGCSRLSEIYQHVAIAIEDHSFGHFLVFPNPAHDKLYICSTNDWTEGLTIRVSDIKGRILFTNYIKSTNAGQNLELDLTHIGPGEYWLQIIHDKDIKNFLFSKQ